MVKVKTFEQKISDFKSYIMKENFLHDGTKTADEVYDDIYTKLNRIIEEENAKNKLLKYAESLINER